MPHVVQVDGAATWVVEDGAVLGRAGAGGVVDKHSKKGRSFEGLYEWEIEQGPRRARTTRSARMALLDEAGIWAQVIFPDVVGLGGQALGGVGRGRRVPQPLPGDLQRQPTPRCRRSRATACSRWRSCPRGTSTRACAKRSAARRTGDAGREHHLRPAGPGRARTSRTGRGTRCGRRARRCRCRCTSTSARQPHDDERSSAPTPGPRTTTTPSSRSAARCCSSGTAASS